MSQPTGLRTAGQIRQQLKQVMFRHLQREIRESFKQTPEACFHNEPVGLGASGSVHLCHLKEGGKPRKMLCDSRQWGGLRQARNCPVWEPKRNKDRIKTDFRALVSGPRGVLAAAYPDVAALMWVLDGVDEGGDIGELLGQIETEADAEVAPPPEVLPASDPA